MARSPGGLLNLPASLTEAVAGAPSLRAAGRSAGSDPNVVEKQLQ